MKLSIAKDQLIAGLQAVQNVVSTRTTLPILSNVHARTEDGRLYLTATNLDVTVTCGVEAQVTSAGATTIPVKRLFSIVRELPVGEVELETDDKNLTKLSAGASYYKMNGLSAEEFPPLPKFKETGSVTLPQDKLRAMLLRAGLIDFDGSWTAGDTHLVFLGDYVDRGPNGLEARLVPERGYPVAWIRAAALRGKGLAAKVLLPFNLLVGFWQSAKAILNSSVVCGTFCRQ
mgnify:CR=1 FL=1